MAASKYDFSIDQGTSFKMVLTFKKEDGSLLPLNGWCARLVWKTNTNIVQEFSSNNLDHSIYKFVLDEALSKMTLYIPAQTTNSFNFSTAKYDLELQSSDLLYAPDGGNYTTRIIYGVITINKRFSKIDTILDCAT
jgi:hypothetical protein